MDHMRRLRFSEDQGGFSLIEVVISAAILLVVTMGTLSLIDGSQDIETKNRGRTTAASLAEQDQERLRSTSAITLAGNPTNPAVWKQIRDASVATGNSTHDASLLVGGVPYRVTSTAQWQYEGGTGGPPSCTDGVAQYLRISSEVTETRANDGVPPVKLTSLLTPAVGVLGTDTGTLIVKVVNHTGTDGVAGAIVTVDGPSHAMQTTNAAGCAVFNHIPTGSPTPQPYTVTIHKDGYVDKDGKSDVSDSATLVGGTTKTITASYDQAVSVQAEINGGNAKAYGITLSAGDGSNITRTFSVDPPSAPSATIDATNLFPFTEGYSVYSGVCSVNDPSKYGGSVATTIAPGSPPKPVPVTQPTVLLPKEFAGLQIHAQVIDPDCATHKKYVVSPTSHGSYSSLSLPWGPYDVCVDMGAQSYTLTKPFVNNGTSPDMASLDGIPGTAGCP